jgi:DNA-binding MarR family transcriptional regulator
VRIGVREDRDVTSPAPDDLATRLYVVVGRLVRTLRRTGSADISPGALSALASLSRGGSCRLGDLATREGVAAPTMTRIVAVLEDGGLVFRAPDPEDRRAVLVDATDAGRELVEGESFARSSALRRRMAALSAEDRAALEAAVPVLEALARDELLSGTGEAASEADAAGSEADASASVNEGSASRTEGSASGNGDPESAPGFAL